MGSRKERKIIGIYIKPTTFRAHGIPSGRAYLFASATADKPYERNYTRGYIKAG